MIRCENCGYENPAGALVCRRCRHRLVIRREGGPRRESEAELTLVVAAGLTRLAAVIGAILGLGVILALALSRRLEPGLLGIAITAGLLALAGRRHVEGLRRGAPSA
ncbi:MAG TPA: hypothetical protein VGR25_12065 [bacterium]|nr:hypothetical protein [bacterium]